MPDKQTWDIDSKGLCVNLNDYILARLTLRGELIYEARHGSAPEKDADGYTQLQLWEFINTFGTFMSIGYNVPCKPDVKLRKGT